MTLSSRLTAARPVRTVASFRRKSSITVSIRGFVSLITSFSVICLLRNGLKFRVPGFELDASSRFLSGQLQNSVLETTYSGKPLYLHFHRPPPCGCFPADAY